MTIGPPEPLVAATVLPRPPPQVTTGMPAAPAASRPAPIEDHGNTMSTMAIGAELREILDGGIGLVGAAGGVDHVDLIAEFVGGLGCALDVAGIVGFGGADRDDADQRLVLGEGRERRSSPGVAARTPRDRFFMFFSPLLVALSLIGVA